MTDIQPQTQPVESDKPFGNFTQKQIAAIIVGTLSFTFILLFGINMLISRASSPAQPSSNDLQLTDTSETPLPTAEVSLSASPTLLPTPSPSPSPTPKVSPTASASASPTASPTPSPTPASTTVTITTPAGQHGYVDNNATASASQEIRVGRTTNSTIRGLVGFDLGSLAKSVKISKATLRLYQTSVTGSPYAVGGSNSITVDHLDFGSSISGSSYSGGNVYSSGFGTISSSATTEWKEIDVTERVKYDLANHTSAQFRLRFNTETQGGDSSGDYAVFSSKNSGFDSNPPQLVVIYN